MRFSINQIYQKFNERRGRRIFILPTRFGVVYAGFIVLILLGAINYSNSLSHLLCFLLTSMGIITMLHTYRNLAKIELIDASAEPVFLGQTIHFNLLFDNKSRHPSHQIELASKQIHGHRFSLLSYLSGFIHHHAIALLNNANKTQPIRYSLPSQKRGRQSLGRIRIASRFPLGLYISWTYFNTDISVLIYPTPHGDLPLPVSSQSGDQLVYLQQKGSEDFSGLNRYRTGDSLNAIAWKAWARDDIFRIKYFTDSHGDQLLFRWEDVNSLDGIEAKLSQLSQWIIDAEAAGLSYALSLPNVTTDYHHGIQHYHQCLTVLALYDA